jgi:RNA polymerase sigma-70 factor (ECF subfamily)
MPDSLLTQARAGDRDAFATLVRAHQGSVFSIGLRMLSRRDAAEDLAQDVFLQLYRKLDSIESLEHLGFWLRRVAANLAIDWLRRLPYSATQPLDENAEVAASETDEDPLMSRELMRLLGELAPHPRAVMLLRYQEDRDVAEIAAMLDMPVNTVKSHIKRSLTALHGQMIGAKLIDCEELP